MHYYDESTPRSVSGVAPPIPGIANPGVEHSLLPIILQHTKEESFRNVMTAADRRYEIGI
ncbi:hypothetical protein MJO29_008358 [Puccinia striiformis f. sp. tritici]|nr:hypothetical protein MJO29_008358 [Puccinia striiformis f. sp. tritici]